MAIRKAKTTLLPTDGSGHQAPRARETRRALYSSGCGRLWGVPSSPLLLPPATFGGKNVTGKELKGSSGYVQRAECA